LDRTPPLCSYPTPPPPFVSNSSVWLPVSSSDALSPVLLTERVDGGVSSEARSSRAFERLSEGLHTWSLLCVDAAGNAAPQWLTVNTTVDVTPPRLTLTARPDRFVNVTAVRVCASAVDANAASLQLSSVDGSAVVTVVSTTDSPHSSCWTVTASGDGNHSVVVSSVDAAGNAPTPLHAWFVVDTSPPTHVATLRNDTHCAVGDVTVCDALVLDVGCSSSGSASVSIAAQSPCRVDVAVALLRRTSGGSSCDTGSSTPVNGSDVTATQQLSCLSLPSDARTHDARVTTEGLYAVMVRSADAAGNVGPVSNISVWLDVTPPSSPPTLTRTPDAVTLQTDGLFELRYDDGSPGQLAFGYQHTWNGGGDDTYTAVPTLPSTPTSPVLLSLPRLVTDASHLLQLVAVDQLRRRSGAVTAFSWRVLSAAPTVNVTRAPSNMSALHAPTFWFLAVWGGVGAGGLSLEQLSAVTFQVRLLGLAGQRGVVARPVSLRRQRECVRVAVQRCGVRVHGVAADSRVVHAAGARDAECHEWRGERVQLDVQALRRQRVCGAERRQRRRDRVQGVSERR
jgi:hypothetical protein